MPTGYTSGVADGSVTSLRAYALRCARALGALVDMRDDPANAAMPRKLAPNTKYCDEELAEAYARLASLEQMTESAKIDAATIHAAERRLANDRLRADRDAIRQRYEAMLDRVKGWTESAAPEGLREFMTSQLEESIEYDCSYVIDDRPVQSAADWYADQLKQVARDIAYGEKERAAEIGRVAERNAWLAQLWAALPPEETP